MGKVSKQSLPHVSVATPTYTVFQFDSIGRARQKTRPDGSSIYTYAYAGNTVTKTDATGKWKKFVADALGNLTEVDEPSPHSGTEPAHLTLYSYDLVNHLTQVRMDRTIGGVVKTQYRTWTYDPLTQHLTSKTTPEAGTVSYTYNNDATLATVTDAKSQRQVFAYDNYGRVTRITRGTVSGSTFTENTAQRTTCAYAGTNNGYVNSSSRNHRRTRYALSIESYFSQSRCTREDHLETYQYAIA